jgi:hypothetical protein
VSILVTCVSTYYFIRLLVGTVEFKHRKCGGVKPTNVAVGASALVWMSARLGEAVLRDVSPGVRGLKLGFDTLSLIGGGCVTATKISSKQQSTLQNR